MCVRERERVRGGSYCVEEISLVVREREEREGTGCRRDTQPENKIEEGCVLMLVRGTETETEREREREREREERERGTW
jgi:hypothetical protein